MSEVVIVQINLIAFVVMGMVVLLAMEQKEVNIIPNLFNPLTPNDHRHKTSF